MFIAHSILLLFVSIVSVSCSSNTISTDDGGSTQLIDPNVVDSYLNSHHILSSDISYVLTPPRNASPGHPYYWFTGKDQNGDKKFVWVDAWAKNVSILDTELAKDSTTTDQIYSNLLIQRGISKDNVSLTYAYPKSSKEIIWFVQLKQPDHYFYFDFKTGKLLLEHVNGKDVVQ